MQWSIPIREGINHTTSPPFIRVSGTPREMGRQIGEAVREQVQHSLESARLLIADAYNDLQLTWEGAQIQARKYIPFAQEHYPCYVEELQGIAEGANVSFDELAVLNAMEAVTMDALHLQKCTSLAVNSERTTDGHVLVAHNEDWLPEDEADLYIIHATPAKEPPFLAFSYGGLLANIGFNAYGIAQCCDSVYPSDSRIGIPRVVVSRAVLAQSNLGDAIRCALCAHRAAGYNHLLATSDGELYNVEVSARQFAILYSENGVIVHTNHYLDYNMQTIEDEPDELINTHLRYHRAMHLLQMTHKHTLKTLQAIQRDHINYPASICNHPTEEDRLLDREKTIAAIVIDLTSLAMHVAWGNPCQNTYQTYYLDC